MSYAQAAASGPKQTPEEAAAPQPAEVITNESASTASLVDVDMPSVHTVPSDFLEQDVQTETQADRISREEAAKKRDKEAKDKAAAKAKKTDSWLTEYFADLSDNASTAVVAANFAAITGIGGFLAYKAWGLHEKGRLSWQAVGVGAGILAGVVAVEGVIGRYLYKGKKRD